MKIAMSRDIRRKTKMIVLSLIMLVGIYYTIFAETIFENNPLIFNKFYYSSTNMQGIEIYTSPGNDYIDPEKMNIVNESSNIKLELNKDYMFKWYFLHGPDQYYNGNYWRVKYIIMPSYFKLYSTGQKVQLRMQAPEINMNSTTPFNKILTINIVDTSPITDADIRPTTAIYDKNIGIVNKTDLIITTITQNTKYSVSDVKNGKDTILKSCTIDSDSVTIRKEYLQTLKVGKVNIDIIFHEKGKRDIIKTLGISILDSSKSVKKTEKTDSVERNVYLSEDSYVNIYLEQQKELIGINNTLNNGNALYAFPDEAVSVISKNPFKMITTAIQSSWIMEGKDIEHINSAKEILTPRKHMEGVPPLETDSSKGFVYEKDSQGEVAYDCGYAGISGSYTDYEKGEIFAITHNEDHYRLSPIDGSGVPGFCASIGIVKSSDSGKSFNRNRLDTPIITSYWGKKKLLAWSGQNDYGAAEPSIVKDITGKYLYIYYTEHSRFDENKNIRGVQVCMARASINSDIMDPKNWKKYYNGKFSENGVGGRDSIIFNAAELLNRVDAEAVSPHVIYSQYMTKYIMTLIIPHWSELSNPMSSDGKIKLNGSGIYISFSDDGIKWQKPIQLISENVLPLGGNSLAWQATIIWDEEGLNSDGFKNGVNNQGYLVYGYTDNWNDACHYMVGRRIQFVKAQKKKN